MIDPAWDVDAICDALDTHNCRPSMVLLTHTHPDHVNGVTALRERLSLPLYVHPDAAAAWPEAPADSSPLAEGQVLELGETRLRVWITPGHAPGHACFLLDGDIIVGDTIFVYGCGHCRMPGADPAWLHQSLQRLKRDLPGHTVIYPGHDYGVSRTSTMTEQVAGNPYLQIQSQAEFVRFRNGPSRSTPFGPVS